MAQEAIRMRAGEDDRMDVRIAVHPINQFFQFSGDRGIEQRMRASVETGDKYPGVALIGDVPHGLRARSGWSGLPARTSSGPARLLTLILHDALFSD